MPSGIDTVNVLPAAELALGPDRAAVQPDQLLHQGQADPRPSCVRPRAPSTRWNRSKSRGISSAGMPVPVSRTDSSTADPAARSETAISPSRVNLKALETRFRTIFSHMSRSTIDRLGQRRAVHRQLQPGPLAGRAEVAGQLRGQRGQVGRLVDRPDPAGLDAGEVEQGVDQLQQPQAVAMGDLQPLAMPRGRAPSGAARTSSTGPSIRVSGVRNSWLTLEKKAVLARSSSASASARRRSSS